MYELPPHHHIEQMPVLKPVADIQFMTNKFRHSVCSLLGIPPEMVMADHESHNSSGKQSRGGKATSRIFQNKMSRMCMFLSNLLEEVHELIYKERAHFHLIALPRLEIQGMEDLKTLHEIGVLQPDHAIQLSEVLLGPSLASGNSRSKRRKLQQRETTGEKTTTTKKNEKEEEEASSGAL